MKTISVRQPWAWMIVCDLPNAKNIENRTWPTRERGWIQIHAAQGMTHEEYAEAVKFAYVCGIYCIPKEADFKRGGIIGMARLVGCVKSHRSRWFTGPWGFVLEDAYPLPFDPCPGQRGFFEPHSFAPPSWGKK